MPPGWVTVTEWPSALYAVVQVRLAAPGAAGVAGSIVDSGWFQAL